MYVALVVALVALVLLTAFNTKVRNTVIWLTKKAIASLIIAIVSLSLAVLAVQVLAICFILFGIFGLIGCFLWGVKSVLESVVPWFVKRFDASADFGYNSLSTIRTSLKTITKKVWNRWS